MGSQTDEIPPLARSVTAVTDSVSRVVTPVKPEESPAPKPSERPVLSATAVFAPFAIVMPSASPDEMPVLAGRPLPRSEGKPFPGPDGKSLLGSSDQKPLLAILGNARREPY